MGAIGCCVPAVSFSPPSWTKRNCVSVFEPTFGQSFSMLMHDGTEVLYADHSITIVTADGRVIGNHGPPQDARIVCSKDRFSIFPVDGVF